MNYLVKGLLASAGWYVGKLVFEMVEEITFNRLHQQVTDSPKLVAYNGQIKEKQTIGFKID